MRSGGRELLSAPPPPTRATWLGGTGGYVEPGPTDWRLAWTLDRSPVEPVGVLDEARSGAFASGQWAFVTEHEGVVYQLYLREVLPAL